MSKVMQYTPLGALLERMAGEYAAKRSIFEIPELAFRPVFDLEAASPGLAVMGGRASLPIGPAAGPHSQIAPNLVSAYLAGARVFELKTVQDNDALEVGKPCILALDEGHNVEWSSELSLEQARREYLNGWIAINLLAGLWSARPRDFFFNVSVGYTLEGIQGKKVDAFLEGLRTPADTPYWKTALGELAAFIESPIFRRAFGPAGAARTAALAADFPAAPVHSLTLSTMHGCPPAEIERIGRYLIEEKGFDACVKLNPTLLGYDQARTILDATGWTDIRLKRESFEHDLQWNDALDLIGRLSSAATGRGRRFGIKLSNTLANANDGAFLPGGERYMSGRPLFPLTVRLAARLAEALPGFPRRFSYCAGVTAMNAGELIEAGLGPLSLATDILKPGGYLRLVPIARAVAAALVRSAASGEGAPDLCLLAALADASLERPEYRKEWKRGSARIDRPLPLFDCFAAPCIEACPVGQKVPGYLRLAAAGAVDAALDLIIEDNPLPRVTGTLCDHVCQTACSRNDYEGPVEIRAVKLACAQAGRPAAAEALAVHPVGKAAVLGAGPAGLACAHYLASAGMPVTVFDKAAEAGGVPANVIPHFRIERAELERDIRRIASLGVEFHLGVEAPSIAGLKKIGFSAVFVAVGAPAARPLALTGSGVRTIDALAFLEAAAGRPEEFAGCRRIVVAGGGNTAMDAVRLAARLPGVESVKLSYRRGKAEMPADREELDNAVDEAWALGHAPSAAPRAVREVELLLTLSQPEAAAPGRLTLRRMKLGEPDRSGRRSPLPGEETFELACDLLVAAVGESPDRALLEALGLPLDEAGRPVHDGASQATPLDGVYVGGDAGRGPASIITAEADGRRAARAILAAAGFEAPRPSSYRPLPPDPARLAARGELAAPLGRKDAGFIAREAERCLACDSACLRCVEVCPNRANAAVPAGLAGGQAFQILHLDRYCNECGNCGVFCPWQGEPYRDKPTLFADRASLAASPNAGFALIEGVSPGLAYRAERGGPVIELDHAAWASAHAAGMPAFARRIHLEQRYLF